MPQLSRHRESGKILDNGTPIMLRGGHYDLFVGDKKPDRGIACPRGKAPFELRYNATPCPSNANRPTCLSTAGCAKMMKWEDENLKWTKFFNVLVTQKINLLRIWLTNGTRVDAAGKKPLDIYPFVSVQRGTEYRWQVRQAIVNGQWNNEYFKRLTAFADAAALAGVNLQITLFNYQDLVNEDGEGNFRAWSHSPWNPSLSDAPPTDTWGTQHLVQGSTNSARQQFFISPNNSLHVVQKAFVQKVVDVLKGRGNIIFEIMNEPRGSHLQVARFSAAVIDWIKEEAKKTNWSPLISVNACNRLANPEKFDIDWWKEHSTPNPDPTLFVKNYESVDIISYHGLTGYDSLPLSQPPEGCNRKFEIAPIGPGHILKRHNQHRQDHRQGSDRKALMYSTDAVLSYPINVLEHVYCDHENPGEEVRMLVRDGQIITNLANNSSEPEEILAAKSDLQNWAYWCFIRGFGLRGGGTVHFHNHSGFESTYRLIHLAYQQAEATRMPQ